MNTLFYFIIFLILFLFYILLFNYKIIEGSRNKKSGDSDKNLEEGKEKMQVFDSITEDV
tara:strand:- start:1421 stop:1597 length:177 start_codon:yes stop_codon:yes gene_type:complete